MSDTNDNGWSRRDFVQSAVSGAVLVATPTFLRAAGADAGAGSDKAAVLAQIPGQHAQNIKRLQDWIALPSIAAENRNYPQGAEYMAKLAADAGFTGIKIIPTSGKPGVFGRLDAGAQSTLAVYFMYDVKQFVPEEWSSPPLEARLVEKPGMGTVCMGRGAVNQKGPQNAFLGELAALRRDRRQSGSAAAPQALHWCAAAQRCPETGRQRRGGGRRQGHRRARAGVERREMGPGPEAGHPFEPRGPGGFAFMAPGAGAQHAGRKGRAHAGGRRLLREGPVALRRAEEDGARLCRGRAGGHAEERIWRDHWVHDEDWQTSLLRLYSQPTINIEGLVGGYTGPGGKTVLPHRAVAKIDMRLVPDMTTTDTLEKLKNYLAQQGFGDIEVNMTGGYNPTQTDPDSTFFEAVVGSFLEFL